MPLPKPAMLIVTYTKRLPLRWQSALVPCQCLPGKHYVLRVNRASVSQLARNVRAVNSIPHVPFPSIARYIAGRQVHKKQKQFDVSFAFPYQCERKSY